MLYLYRILFNQDQGEGGTPSSDPPADGSSAAVGAPAADPTPDAKPGDDGKGAGSKEAVLADLHRERDRRKTSEKEVRELKESMVENTKANEDFKAKILKAIGGEETDDPEAALDAANKKTESITAKAKNALLKARVETEAAALNCHDPAAVFAVGNSAGAFAGVEVDLDKAEVGDVKSLVEKMVSDSPWLAKAPGDQSAGGSPPGSDPDPDKADAGELKEMIAKAKSGDEMAMLQVSKNIKRIRELKLM